MKKLKEVVHMGDDNKCHTCFDDGFKKGIKKAMAEVYLLIDHYTPYRPITDSKEAKEIREALSSLYYKLKEYLK